MIDVLTAIAEFLKADTGVALEVDDRVFRAEMHPREVEEMPRKAIVLRHAGGPGKDNYLRVDTWRVDVYSYGVHFGEASDVMRAAFEALDAILRVKQGSALIHWAKPDSGPIDIRFTETDWPAYVQSWLVRFSEQAAA